MKTAAVSVLSFLCLPALPLLAADSPDSAYQALRVVGTERGKEALNHVIEVTGRNGVPQPVAWVVVLDDPASRGGVRELEIEHGKIVAEHTPVQAYSGSAQGAVIDFHKLNLDSPGLFTVVEKEAEKNHIGFDSVDYTLRTGDGPDAGPVWVVSVVNHAGHSVGTMTVGAETGAVVSSEMTGHAAEYADTPPVPPPAYSDDHDNVNNPPAVVEDEPQRPPPDANDTDDTQGLHIKRKIKQAFVSAGESMANFFTGRHSD